jgi:hypothetical protein
MIDENEDNLQEVPCKKTSPLSESMRHARGALPTRVCEALTCPVTASAPDPTVIVVKRVSNSARRARWLVR